MKVLIFDSGPLINLSMNGLLYLLEKLKKDFDGKFIITRQVKYEVVDRPIDVKRFELGALRIQNLIDSGVLELSSSLGISDEAINRETKKFMESANHCVTAHGRAIQIVSEAEISCLALSSELSKKGVESLVAVDERTTRILGEKPQNLEKIMSHKLHQDVEINIREIEIFSKFRFIRSPEIVYAAYKKGLLGMEGKKALEAALYATKFNGSAVSFEEIDVLKKL